MENSRNMDIHIHLAGFEKEGDEMGDVRERSNNAVGLEVMAEYYLLPKLNSQLLICQIKL